MNPIHIRPLKPTEWQRFRDFRLAALRDMPAVFFRSYDEEAAYPEERWRDAITGHARQVFGLFDGETLVGLTNVCAFLEEFPDGKTAILGMSYLLPDYRGCGLSGHLYKVRLEWLHAHPQFDRVLVHHRESNAVSGRANQHHGFVPIGRASQKWPDGTVEDEIIYELKLK